jgi:tetratricopeptide (TPR) repeat protein
MFRKAAESQTAGWLPLQLARVDYRAGRHDLARAKLEQYVQQHRRFGGQEPYRLLQKLMESAPSAGEGITEKRADAKSVVDRFRDWLTDDPENSALLSFVADLSRRRGILLKAAELYEQSLEQQSTLEAYRGLIATYRELGDGEKLLNVLGRVVAKLQRLDPLADELAKIVRDRELLKRLLDLGRKQLAADQAVRRGIVAACGFMAIDARQYEVADEFFEQLATSESESELFTHWGLELLLAGESDRAATVFRRTLDSQLADDDEAVLLYYLAGALQLGGKTDAALRAARSAAKLRNDIPAFKLRPAWILFNAGRYDEAEIAYTAWLQAFGDDYSAPELRQSVRDARFVMSNICIAGKRHDEATEWLEQMLDEFPQDVGVMNDLGYLLVDRGRSLEHALRMIRRAVEAEPNNAAYRDSLGWAYYRLGQYAVAIAELKTAVSVDNPDPIILDHLGDAQLAGGDSTAAKETWQRALVSLEAAGPNEELKSSLKGKLRLQPTESK